jgi:hypothetical protein
VVLSARGLMSGATSRLQLVPDTGVGDEGGPVSARRGASPLLRCLPCRFVLGLPERYARSVAVRSTAYRTCLAVTDYVAANRVLFRLLPPIQALGATSRRRVEPFCEGCESPLSANHWRACASYQSRCGSSYLFPAPYDRAAPPLGRGRMPRCPSLTFSVALASAEGEPTYSCLRKRTNETN